MKKSVLCAAAFTMLFGFTVAGAAMGEDKGPAEMTLTTADAKKPAIFPHAKHQEKLACDDCHKALDVKKMATIKDYAHKEGCKECHKTKNAPTACPTCHPAKKKAIEGC
ncbi:MAG: cytochrome c3 family protein [Proteobacteria bacterium]|nr:cytochrome c3 family protein [Pseudomonadota bacterium]MBU1639557.1 cytochrome c3 family protein [Pseudomonadota bacterium]